LNIKVTEKSPASPIYKLNYPEISYTSRYAVEHDHQTPYAPSDAS